MTPNFSVISRSEVIEGMKHAKNSKLQKRIFADLCCCSVKDIERIIKEDQMANCYSAADIDYIKKAVANGVPNREIASKLGRETRSVEQKIYNMRLSGEIPRTRRRDTYTAQQTAASEVRIVRPADKIAEPRQSTDSAEIEFYKKQLAAAEAALSNAVQELKKERMEMQVLVKLLSKAVNV